MDAHAKLAKLNSKRSSQDRVTTFKNEPTRSTGARQALRMDSTQHFDESMSNSGDQSPVHIIKLNKMHKMMDARREWEQRHCSNSPFRATAYGSSTSLGFESIESPISANKGYAVRASGFKGEQCLTADRPITLTNKQSSFFKKKNNSSIQQKNPPLGTTSPIRAAPASTLSSGSAESLSPNFENEEGEIHEGFGSTNGDGQEGVFLEGECYLKTKTDRFKEHWAVLNGNEIFCYRS